MCPLYDPMSEWKPLSDFMTTPSTSNVRDHTHAVRPTNALAPMRETGQTSESEVEER